MDYFLYSCFEFEQTCKATPHRSLGAERWPALVAHLEGDGPRLGDIGSIQEQFDACLKWYSDTFPNLISENSLNLDNINNIIPGVVFLGLDLKTIVSSDSTFEELKYSEVRPDTKLWGLIEKTLKKFIPNFSRQSLAYLQWAYGEKEEKQWEIGSRPPIGRYAPSFRKTRGGNSSRPDRGERKDRGDRPNGNRKGGNRSRNNPKRGGSDHKEKSALTDVNNAVKKLKENNDLSEIKLKPANSFYRRLQHKHAISQGFESISSGEGNDRSVVVMRAKD